MVDDREPGQQKAPYTRAEFWEDIDSAVEAISRDLARDKEDEVLEFMRNSRDGSR